MDSVTVQEATTETQAIPSYRPDAKTRRYDRQLRLWASSGQKSLESARVLLIGADATGCQSLKNLILPGIAHYTILSPQITSAQDISTNFFLVPESLGEPAAREACALLGELNGSVEGAWRAEDPKHLLGREPGWFLGFTMIIASNVEPELELAIADLLWRASDNPKKSPDIPLISVRNSGFIGLVRTQYREHCIIDTHPDTLHTLRIDTPFPALERYARELDLESMDSMEHSHVPYVVLLVKALEEWKEQNRGKEPGYEDLDAVKQILGRSRKALDEENFDEAESQAFRAVQASEIPSQIKELFQDPSCQNLSKDSKNFWILVNALHRYTLLPSSRSLLPLSASLPDMKASTSSYVTLQNLYKARAREDVLSYRTCLNEVLKEVGLESGTVDDEEVEAFVKNCAGLTVCRGRSLKDVVEADVRKEEITSELSMDSTGMAYYLGYAAASDFFSKHGRWPGNNPAEPLDSEQDDLERDANEVTEIFKGKLKQVGWAEDIPVFFEECVGEICRGGASTIPTTAAFLGGVVAQEAIKLVTSQYIPLNNTSVIDLVKGGVDKYML